jgi:hypothetical protein
MAGTLGEYTHLCSELVTFSVMESTHTGPTTLIGNLEEISEWKARVLVDRPVSRGAQVTLNAGSYRLCGSVRSWSFEPVLGYLVEVQLDSRWSATAFNPQHLLRIEDLAGDAAVVAA